MKKRYGLTKGLFYKERSNKNNNKHSKDKNNKKENGVSLGFRIGNLVIFDYRKDYVAGIRSKWQYYKT